MVENNKPEPFQIGLCLAGAISAGAYTAGVLDYLIETLEIRERKKLQNGADQVPSHAVTIPIIGGASAGRMTEMILGTVLKQRIDSVTHLPNAENSSSDNPVGYLGNLLTALVSQVPIKPEHLSKALFSDKVGQLEISPIRYSYGTRGKIKVEGAKTIACGSLDGFEGFQIIPIFSKLADTPYSPTWSDSNSASLKMRREEIEAYRPKVKKRVSKIVLNAADLSNKDHALLWAVSKEFITPKLTKLVMNTITDSLIDHSQLSER